MSGPIAEIKDRLSEALKIRRTTAAELSRKTGISTGSLSQYRSGKVKPKQDRIYLMAQALRVDEAWLMGHDVPMERGAKSSSLVAQHIANIPIYNSVSCTMNGWIKDQAEGRITFPFGWLGIGKYFANIVEDNSMAPIINEGNIIIFEETSTIEPDQIGAFFLNGNYYCRKFKILPDGSRWLFSSNPHLDPISIKSSDQFRVLGVYTAKISKEQEDQEHENRRIF